MRRVTVPAGTAIVHGNNETWATAGVAARFEVRDVPGEPLVSIRRVPGVTGICIGDDKRGLLMPFSYVRRADVPELMTAPRPRGRGRSRR